ncbi:MAG: ABC transporter substrate-binding protein [Actinomycetota bacterium]
MRIASLVPAATDLVATLGLADSLVGVSHECDHPAVSGLPVLTRSLVPAAGAVGATDPGEVDRAVSSALAAGDALYVTDRELLAELRPDLVVTQGVCDVCAVTSSSVVGLLPPGAHIVELTATTVSGLGDDVRRVAAAARVDASAHDVIAEVSATLDAVRAAVAGRPRPRVLTLEWGDPPFIGGHWVPELVGFAGGDDVLGTVDAPSRRASWDEIVTSSPDAIAFIPCGYGLDHASAHLSELVDGPLGQLGAVAAGECWAFDANALFSRCTPDAVAGAVRALAQALHPHLPEPDAVVARRLAR